MRKLTISNIISCNLKDFILSDLFVKIANTPYNVSVVYVTSRNFATRFSSEETRVTGLKDGEEFRR